MIHRFLVVSNYVYLSSVKVEDEHTSPVNIDLRIPLENFWRVQEWLREVDYLLASKEHTADVQDLYRKVFKEVLPFTVFEADRLWLVNKMLGGAGSSA